MIVVGLQQWAKPQRHEIATIVTHKANYFNSDMQTLFVRIYHAVVNHYTASAIN